MQRAEAIGAFEADYDHAIVPNNVVETINAIGACDANDAVKRSMPCRHGLTHAVAARPHSCSVGAASRVQCQHGLTRASSVHLGQRSRRLVVSGMFSDCTLGVVTCGAAARHELKRRKRGVRSDARECAAEAIDTFIQSKRSVRSSRRCDRCDRRVRRDLCERVERC